MESYLIDTKSAPVLLIFRDELSGDIKVTQNSPMSAPLPKYMFFLLKLEDTETGNGTRELQTLQRTSFQSYLTRIQADMHLFFKSKLTAREM